MKKIMMLLPLLVAMLVYPQHRVMQVHSEGDVAYEINTAQVDSVTFMSSLANTKWKLIGIMDINTGVLKELEPNSCEHCYMLEFETEAVYFCSSEYDMPSSTYIAQAVDIGLQGCYGINYTLSTIQFIGAERPDAEDIYDGEFYIECIAKIQAFEQKGIQLKLYYNDRKSYLLFNYKERGGELASVEFKIKY